MVLLVPACAAAAAAHTPAPATAGPGSAVHAPADTISILDGVYSREQAAGGRRVFERECTVCHAPAEFSGRLFQLTWGNQPLERLYDRIRTNMPLDNPGSLSPEDYAAVVAYLLELNGYPAGESALPTNSDALARIRMVRLPVDGR